LNLSVHEDIPQLMGNPTTIRLSLVSEAYIKALTKKIEIDIDATSGKIHPVEALGVVMIGHGNEFGDESVYG
jgi:hypothetical protein